MGEEKERVSGEATRPGAPLLPTSNPVTEKSEPASGGIPSFVYVTVWIGLSSSVILFNKWILSTKAFHYPILLTAWHLSFATFMTQVLARTSTLLDGRKKVAMTGRVYLRAIVPIGVFFSLSLICGNLTYLYLSVSFIQMIKATTPVGVLIASWVLGTQEPSLKTLFNISFIVIGVIIASFGEINFVLIGFLFQCAGIVFEAIRIVMVERLLSSAEFKMDPLVSLYYFAPVCAVMNIVIAMVVEIPKMTIAEVYNVGLWTLLANAMVAFCLNVSVVFLIGKTSGLVLTLCGVLKDILLVCASVLIFGTPVSGLQMFGYTIAICGMLWYRLGAEQIKGHFSDASRQWAEFGINRPILRKLVIFGGALTVFFILLSHLAPTYAPDYDPKNFVDAAKNAVGSV